MKWLKRIAVALLLLVLAIVAYVSGTARRSARPVGFQVVQASTPTGTVALAVWYPTVDTPRPTTFVGGNLLSVARDGRVAGADHPLVVISHGNEGSALSHVDLAMDLASAGYVVAAPTHAGDNFADRSRQSAPTLFADRAGQVRAAIDYMLQAWPQRSAIDSSRVGAYGFSAGAFTVLTLSGAVPDMAAIGDHCTGTPEFVCKMLTQVGSPLVRTAEGAGTFEPDARIGAAVIAAPGLGFTFADGLSGVRIPLQMWNGDEDDTVPYATNGQVVARALGTRVEVRTLAGATHLAFLAPCGLLKPPLLCSDPPRFDRGAAHRAMNAEVIRFFDTHLGAEKSDQAH